jgi:hypothetical protein
MHSTPATYGTILFMLLYEIAGQRGVSTNYVLVALALDGQRLSTVGVSFASILLEPCIPDKRHYRNLFAYLVLTIRY